MEFRSVIFIILSSESLGDEVDTLHFLLTGMGWTRKRVSIHPSIHPSFAGHHIIHVMGAWVERSLTAIKRLFGMKFMVACNNMIYKCLSSIPWLKKPWCFSVLSSRLGVLFHHLSPPLRPHTVLPCKMLQRAAKISPNFLNYFLFWISIKMFSKHIPGKSLNRAFEQRVRPECTKVR